MKKQATRLGQSHVKVRMLLFDDFFKLATTVQSLDRGKPCNVCILAQFQKIARKMPRGEFYNGNW